MFSRLTSGRRRQRSRPPLGPRRPVLYLAAAAAGAVLVSTVAGAEPESAAATDTQPVSQSMSVAQALGLPQDTAARGLEPDLSVLENLAASRSQRGADEAGAAEVQAAAEQAEHDRRAAEQAAAEQRAAEQAAAEQRAAEQAERDRRAAEQAERDRQAAEQAERDRRAAEQRAAEQADRRPAPSSAAQSTGGQGSFKDYARAQVGSQAEFQCLEALWGRESGWNPTAQNPRSTAYGIAQFLDSTWAGTGIAKTSDGYRQIDAGLIYIQNRYGSPCGAWAHSQATGWY